METKELLGWIVATILFLPNIWPLFTKKTIPEVLADWGVWKVKAAPDTSSVQAGRQRWWLGIRIASIIIGIALFAVLVPRLFSDLSDLAELRIALDATETEIAQKDLLLRERTTQIEELKSEIETMRADHDASSDPSAMVVAMNLKVISGTPVIELGRETKINMGITNDGPNRARNVKWQSGVQYLPKPVSRSHEKLMLDDFAAFLEGLMDGRNKLDLAPDKGAFSTISLTFNDDQLSALRNDQARLYVMVKWVWEDSSGVYESENCHYLRPPGDEETWRYCQSHNFDAR